MARLALLGDVMLGRLVSQQLRCGRQPESCWGDVGPALRDADGVIANLECAITTHSKTWMRSPKAFHFAAHPMAIDVLKAGNITAVSLANNHTLDFEIVGLLDTLDHLDRAGIAHAGAGRSQSDAFAPALFEVGGIDVALFAVTDNEPKFAARAADPGTAYVDLSGPESALRPSAAEIHDVRAKGAKIAVLSCHLGPNMVLKPSHAIRSYRASAVTRGIDIVYGHSAHLTQGVERVAHSLILHDTGDFLDDYAVDTELRNDWSFIFFLEIDAAGVQRLNLTPVLLGLAEVRRAKSNEANALCTRMIRLSSEFGTAFSRTEDGLELVLRP